MLWNEQAQLLPGDRATRRRAKEDCWNERRNDKTRLKAWNDLQMYFSVVKSVTNRKLYSVWLPIVVYIDLVTFAVSRTIFLRIMMWNSLMTLIYRQGRRQSHHVKAIVWTWYVKYSEDSEPKKRKSPLSTTTLSFDADSRGTPANICINLILPETTFPVLHFCRWQYG